MSYTRLLTRATHGRNSNKTIIIVGLVCGALAIAIGMVALIRCSNRNNHGTSYEPESNLARAQRQRREYNGWWGAEPARVETAAERRRRNVQVRASRTAESGSEREARREREVREREDAPPKYQRPAPAYYSNPQWRRQHLTGRRQLALSSLPRENDAPPAYDSPAVWPSGVRVP
ncbi:hypothetical protein E8E12_000224 [Didymella heteroderae]|uniref:Uncharacterized protein n=1 Tax=Didymella heteroderae TaxID=1769908 RepID=A0A9P5BUF2_9PLEO|nr:hypothetical protein E8E12_000224 [Didymella heteroderae]